MSLFILNLSHFLHLVATVIWIGGIMMILLVVLPGAKESLESASMVKSLMKEITKRFTPMANISILLLIVTGIIIARGERNFAGFLDFNNTWNSVMFLKHFLVGLMVVIHFYRGLILSAKIKNLSTMINNSQMESFLIQKVKRLQKFSLNLVKTNLILGIVVLMLTGISLSL